MKRKKRSKNNKKRIQKGNKQTKQKPSVSSFFWKLLVGLSVILTIIAFFNSFYPKVSIATEASLDPLNPFRTPFIIENRSLLPIHSIECSFFIHNISAKKTKNLATNFTTQMANQPIKRLNAGEKSTAFVVFPFNFSSPITYGDIDVMISFRPAYWPWRQEKIFHFVTEKDVNNNLRWLHAPVVKSRFD